jgi:hypothetical protein
MSEFLTLETVSAINSELHKIVRSVCVEIDMRDCRAWGLQSLVY